MDKTVVRKRDGKLNTFTSLESEIQYIEINTHHHAVYVPIQATDGTILRTAKMIFKSRHKAYDFIKSYFNIDKIPRAK